jgi:hypothetical protein
VQPPATPELSLVTRVGVSGSSPLVGSLFACRSRKKEYCRRPRVGGFVSSTQAVDSIPKPLPRIGVLQVYAGHSASDLLALTDRPMRSGFDECATVDEAYPSCREGFSLNYGCDEFCELRLYGVLRVRELGVLGTPHSPGPTPTSVPDSDRPPSGTVTLPTERALSMAATDWGERTSPSRKRITRSGRLYICLHCPIRQLNLSTAFSYAPLKSGLTSSKVSWVGLGSRSNTSTCRSDVARSDPAD